MRNMVKTIFIEGNVGAGKSTFLKMLTEYFNIQVVYEPHEQWQDVKGENLLDQFYRDGNRWAYTFQTYAFITRILEQEKLAKINQTGFQFVERSVYSDRYCFGLNCHEIGMMSSLEWSLYQELWEWFVAHYTQTPIGFIYLRTTPEKCYERLLKRNRSEESAVSLEYITTLNDKHEKWLIQKDGIARSLKNVPVLVLDCSKEFEVDLEEQKEYVRQITQFFHFNQNLDLVNQNLDLGL
jgi:deoxyadenosine/deoxycytidine kinase